MVYLLVKDKWFGSMLISPEIFWFAFFLTISDFVNFSFLIFLDSAYSMVFDWSKGVLVLIDDGSMTF